MSDALSQWGPVLRQSDDEFRRLQEEHHAHERRLADLRAQPYPSDEQRQEEVELKKKKLLLKDRMAEIARRFADSRERV
jgi:uncharacterized protein YdcH (DUF465 family)